LPIPQEQYGCCTYDKTFRSLNSSRDFRLRDYLHSWKYFQGYESKIRKQLVFKKHLQHYAEQTFVIRGNNEQNCFIELRREQKYRIYKIFC
jgi:hypothetical protein